MPSSKKAKPAPKKIQARLESTETLREPLWRSKYDRLIGRLYEPLLTMTILGSTRGDHTDPKSSNGSPRRRLLENLAFLCDYKKGGPTVTAIGLEDRLDAHVFWVAANTDVSSKMIQFLKHVIQKLKQLSILVGEEREAKAQQLAQMCTEFARNRIKDEANILRTEASKCIHYLKNQNTTSDTELASWLEQLRLLKGAALCQHAYHTRKSTFMKSIKLNCQAPRYRTTPDDRTSWFTAVRHQLGRLAHHIRAPKKLIEDFQGLQYLFDNFIIGNVPFIQSVPAPVPDSLTTLHGIIRRMVPSHDPKVEEYQEAFAEMDRNFNILNKLTGLYKDPKFQPRVHAEIQVLEHFFHNRLKYLDDDPFIACSKPACLCCQLYIRHHPARCVVPISHQTVYRNWGPPLLAGGIDDPDYITQRDTLNLVIKALHVDVLDQIINRAGPHPWHPVSQTGITHSLDLDLGDGGQNLESQIQSLSVAFEYNFLFNHFRDGNITSLDDADLKGAESSTVAGTISNGSKYESTSGSSATEDFPEDEDSDGGVTL